MKIRIPKEDVFYIAPLSLYGPFHDSGEPFEEIEIDDDTKFFQQGNSLYGENSVSHDKSSGEITINSLISSSDCVPLASPSWTTGSHNITVRNHDGRSRYIHKTYPALVAGGTQFASRITSYYYEAVKHGVENEYAYYATIAVPISKKFPKEIAITCTIYRYDLILRADGSIHSDNIRYRAESCDNQYLKVSSVEEAYAALQSFHPSGVSIKSYGPWIYASKRYSRSKYKANVNSALSWFRKISDAIAPEMQKLPEIQSYGDLVQAACENVNPNTINAIAFIKDLKDVKSLIPKLKQLGSISTHASNYLGLEYGVLPTIDDLKTIWESFRTKYFYDQNGFQRASGYDTSALVEFKRIEGSTVTLTTAVDRRVHLAINTQDSGLDALTERLRKIGVFPSLTNLWDLIPYSFVLDWFVDVGSVLERIDTRHQLLNLDIKYCIQSQKTLTSTSLVNTNEGIFATIDSSSYRRHVGTSVPQPVIFKENRVTAQNHWVEGSALILSRKQK